MNPDGFYWEVYPSIDVPGGKVCLMSISNLYNLVPGRAESLKGSGLKAKMQVPLAPPASDRLEIRFSGQDNQTHARQAQSAMNQRVYCTVARWSLKAVHSGQNHVQPQATADALGALLTQLLTERFQERSWFSSDFHQACTDEKMEPVARHLLKIFPTVKDLQQATQKLPELFEGLDPFQQEAMASAFGTVSNEGGDPFQKLYVLKSLILKLDSVSFEDMHHQVVPVMAVLGQRSSQAALEALTASVERAWPSGGNPSPFIQKALSFTLWMMSIDRTTPETAGLLLPIAATYYQHLVESGAFGNYARETIDNVLHSLVAIGRTCPKLLTEVNVRLLGPRLLEAWQNDIKEAQYKRTDMPPFRLVYEAAQKSLEPAVVRQLDDMVSSVLTRIVENPQNERFPDYMPEGGVCGFFVVQFDAGSGRYAAPENRSTFNYLKAANALKTAHVLSYFDGKNYRRFEDYNLAVFLQQEMIADRLGQVFPQNEINTRNMNWEYMRTTERLIQRGQTGLTGFDLLKALWERGNNKSFLGKFSSRRYAASAEELSKFLKLADAQALKTDLISLGKVGSNFLRYYIENDGTLARFYLDDDNHGLNICKKGLVTFLNLSVQYAGAFLCRADIRNFNKRQSFEENVQKIKGAVESAKSELAALEMVWQQCRTEVEAKEPQWKAAATHTEKITAYKVLQPLLEKAEESRKTRDEAARKLDQLEGEFRGMHAQLKQKTDLLEALRQRIDDEMKLSAPDTSLSESQRKNLWDWFSWLDWDAIDHAPKALLEQLGQDAKTVSNTSASGLALEFLAGDDESDLAKTAQLLCEALAESEGITRRLEALKAGDGDIQTAS